MSQDLKFLTLNRILNPNAPFSVGNWVAFADAAGTAPVDGTGGAPSVTITRSESSPLDGVASFLFTKDAANRQGQGMSSDIILQSSDQTKVFNFSYDYQVSTGTYSEGTSTTQSDFTWWIYDVTNAVMYQAVPSNLSGAVSTTNQYVGAFQWQVPSGCLTARLIGFIPTTSASAYTIKFNNFQLGRLNRVSGAALSAWETVTVTGSWVANTTYTAKRRRIGDSYQYNVHIALAGAPTTAGLNINLPSGDVIDTAKFPTTPVLAATPLIIGHGVAMDTGSATYECTVYYRTTTAVTVQYHQTTGGANPEPVDSSSSVTQAAPVTWGNTDTLDLAWEVPIVGLSANAILGQDADLRNYFFRYSMAGGTYAVPTTVQVGGQWDTKVSDTGGMGITFGSGVTFNWVVPVSGIWSLGGGLQTNSITWAGGNKFELSAFVNGATEYSIFNSDVGGSFASRLRNIGCINLNLAAGQVITYGVNITAGVTTIIEGNPIFNFVSAYRPPGPAQIQASETPSASYNTNAGQSIANASTVIIDFEDKLWDTFSLVTTGSSWKFTANRAGKVYVDATIAYASAVFTNGTNIQLFAYKNGAAYKKLGETLIQAAVSITDIIVLGGSCLVDVVAGDTIDIRTSHGESTARSLTTTATDNYVDIAYKEGL